VSLWGGSFRAAYLAFFKAAGVNPVLVPQYYTVNLFLRGGVVACVAMEYNELHTIIQCGIDRRRLTSIALRGTGFDFPEDGVYTLAATQRRDPDLCRRFAAATMAGWRYCRDHPAEALRIVMRRARAAHVPTNRAHQRWMLEHILASIFPQRPGAWRPGVLARADYERVCATLIDQRLIARAPAYGRFVAPEARGAP
jgi:NitT/TauT family transport system substrate-binding protein